MTDRQTDVSKGGQAKCRRRPAARPGRGGLRAIGAAICMAFLAGCTLGTSESVTEDSEVILVEQTEPATEPATELATEPATELATASVTDPITEPTTDPVSDLDPATATDSATDQAATTVPAAIATAPATEPTTEPTTEPATETITDPATEPHEPDPLWYVTANTEQVRSVIRSMGGVVDAWIVTHYHNDHVDAFTGIYRDPQGIEIRAVYDSPMDYEAYLAVAQWWDAPASYTAYREAVGTSELVHHVVRDETVVIDGLVFEFFNTYDELTSGLGDVPNNASLVFKVTNEEESMLFTADCHSAAVAELLIGRYGERLRADYYQAPHHGNSTNWQAMIEAVQPRVTFLDGPGLLLYICLDDYTSGEV